MEIKDLLLSLLPIILIVIFSWLFSSRGSKQKEEEQIEETNFYSDAKEDEFEEAIEKDRVYHPMQKYMERYANREQGGYFQKMMAGYDTSQYSENPKPIKPKWWGA